MFLHWYTAWGLCLVRFPLICEVFALHFWGWAAQDGPNCQGGCLRPMCVASTQATENPFQPSPPWNDSTLLLWWHCAVAGAAYCHFIMGLTYWDKQPFRLTFTPTGNGVSSVILPCFGSVGWNRMGGNPHRHRRACKLHNGRQWSSLQEKPSLPVYYPFK